MTDVRDEPQLDVPVRLMRPLRRPRSWVLPATVVAVAVVFVVVWTTTGIDPRTAVTTIIDGALGNRDRIAETLARATPLVLVGVGAGLAIRGGVFNVGGEGQMAMGAVVTVLCITVLSSAPAGLVWVVGIAAGAVGGALWAVVPAALAARRGVPAILSTLLVNFATVSFLTWLLTDTFLHDPSPTVITAQGERIDPAFEFPSLLSGTRLHLGVGLAMVVVILASWWTRTPGGLRLDLLGANRSLAAQAGIDPQRAQARLLLVSAAFAGVAGAIQLFGISHRLSPGLTAGVGYTGVLVAVMGRSRPIATLCAALAFASLATGGEALERSGAPRQVVMVLQAVLVVATAVAIRPKAVAT